MKCPNCGTEQPKKAKFCRKCGLRLDGTTCPRCGNPVLSGTRYCGVCGTSLNPKRKGWKVALIVVLCLALAVGGVVGAWQLIWSEDAQLVKVAENYAEVNEALLAVTTADGYDDLTTAEKAEQVLSALDDLADEGKVLADSVGYDESYPLVYYSYADGAYGGVMLEEFAEGTNGVGEDAYLGRYEYAEEDGEVNVSFVDFASTPPFDTDFSPYEQEELTSLIVYELGDGEDVSSTKRAMEAEQQSWSEMYIDTALVEEESVAFYRTGLSGYNLVVIQGHGSIYKNEPAVALQETISTLQKIRYEIGIAFTEEERAMLDDIQSNRVAMVFVQNDHQYHYYLLPAFFSYYYADDGLDDAIVWISCCDGYHNDALVSAFADCGAKAVLAYTETFNTTYGYVMLDAFAYMLMCGNTVEESVAFAQSQWGVNNREFMETVFGEEGHAPSEVRIYCGGDETLVTLTEEGQEALKGTCSGAVIDVTDGSALIAGAMITVTDADGTVAETTTDETGAFEFKLYLGTYTVQIEKEGYESQTEEVTIEAGEESTLLVSLSAEVTDADAQAAYQAFLSDEGYANEIIGADDIQYVMYDLNGDGISELLLHGYSFYISGTYFIYGYDGDVFFVGSCDNFNREGAYYSADENALVIVSSGGADWITYEFYEVSNQLTLTYTMGHQFFGPDLGTVTEDNPLGYEIWSFYIAEAGSEARDVTQAEWNSYIDDLTEIVFSDLSDATTFVGDDLMDTDSKSSAETSDTSDVSDIVLDTDYANDYEYGNIYAYDSDGDLVWSYETDYYPATELSAISEIGLRDGRYYFVEGGTVVAMDAATGEILWENGDFDSYGASAAFAEDCICLAGYYGPDFYAVSYGGATLCEISSFGSEYYWACNVAISGNMASVSLNDGSCEAQINLDTWDYTISDVG